MELEQHHIIRLLHLKGLKLHEIATKLSNLYGQDAYATLTIKYWLHQIKVRRTEHFGGRPRLDDIDFEMSPIAVFLGADNY
jgi:hypothetical protein